MTGLRPLAAAALLVGLLASRLSATTATLDRLSGESSRSGSAAVTASLQDAKRDAGGGFDGNAGDGSFSTPLVPIPEPGTRRPSADLIVGEPGKHKLDEPANPLTKEGKAKPQKSGNQIWWALGGAVAGAGIGFLLGGPIGAAIGGLAGAIAGWFFGP